MQQAARHTEPDRVQARTARSDLLDWYGRALGGLVLECERAALREVLPDLFGYHLLQVGSLGADDILQASRIPHRVVMDWSSGDRLQGAGLVGTAAHMPFAAESIDVLILPHVLEFHDQPHQVLREADRVLVPEGHLVILGFNPWSSWGLRRVLSGRRGRAPWSGQYRSTTRIKDWLALLGFDVLRTEGLFFRPPVYRSGVMQRLQFLERWGQRFWPLLGGVFVLVAIKRVETLTPVRPRWRARPSLVAGVVEPTTRGMGRG